MILALHEKSFTGHRGRSNYIGWIITPETLGDEKIRWEYVNIHKKIVTELHRDDSIGESEAKLLKLIGGVKDANM